MAIYTYPNPGGNYLVLLLKVEKIVGRLPNSYNVEGSNIQISFDPDITVANKTALDLLMADPLAGQIPNNAGNTTYVLNDIMDWRVQFQNLTGIFCMIYPSIIGNWSYEIQFDHALTTQEKNKIRGTWAAWITEKVY